MAHRVYLVLLILCCSSQFLNPLHFCYHLLLATALHCQELYSFDTKLHPLLADDLSLDWLPIHLSLKHSCCFFIVESNGHILLDDEFGLVMHVLIYAIPDYLGQKASHISMVEGKGFVCSSLHLKALFIMGGGHFI